MQSNQGNVNGKSRARYLNEVSIARHPAPDVCVCVCVGGCHSIQGFGIAAREVAQPSERYF